MERPNICGETETGADACAHIHQLCAGINGLSTARSSLVVLVKLAKTIWMKLLV